MMTMLTLGRSEHSTRALAEAIERHGLGTVAQRLDDHFVQLPTPDQPDALADALQLLFPEEWLAQFPLVTVEGEPIAIYDVALFELNIDPALPGPALTAQAFIDLGLPFYAGCEVCGATLAPYNAYPSQTGYTRCSECIGDLGYLSPEHFASKEGR
jgi:hypothetical protein